MFKWLSRKKTEQEGEEKKEVDAGNGEDVEYRQGDLVVVDAKRVVQLRKHDDQAKEIYFGIEQQIQRLKNITKKIRKYKMKKYPELTCLPNKIKSS